MREEYIISYEIKVIPRTSIDSISTQLLVQIPLLLNQTIKLSKGHSACLMSSPPYFHACVPLVNMNLHGEAILQTCFDI